MRGDIPLGLEAIIEGLLEPRLPWRHLLADFVRRMARDNYSYSRPSKRHLHQGLFYPSLYSRTLNIGWAGDTSGSMSDDDLRDGLSELSGILNCFSSYNIHLFGCDCAIHFYDVATPYNEVNIKGLVKGRGGTSFIPVFDKIRDDNLDLDALVYFTDAQGEFPLEPPPFPVLWVVKGPAPVPWGRRCEFESGDVAVASPSTVAGDYL